MYYYVVCIFMIAGYVSTRRKSVFAETYDPEDDEDKDEKVRPVRAML